MSIASLSLCETGIAALATLFEAPPTKSPPKRRTLAAKPDDALAPEPR